MQIHHVEWKVKWMLELKGRLGLEQQNQKQMWAQLFWNGQADHRSGRIGLWKNQPSLWILTASWEVPS